MICGVGVGPDHGVAGLDIQISRRISCADDVHVVGGSACCPHLGFIPQHSGGCYVVGLGFIPRMLVPDVLHAVVVVVEVEVVLKAVAVEVTRPLELVNAAIVVVVLVIGAGANSVSIIIGDAVVVVVHRVLVNSVADSYGGPDPGVNCIRVHIAVGADVPRIGSLRVVDWSLEDAVVVIVPVEFVEYAIVIVVEGVGAVASVKALD